MDNAGQYTNNNFAIKAVCLLGLINASQMVALVNSPMVKHVSSLLPAYFMLAVAISLVCLVGLWFNKKWAALIYAGLLVCNQIVLVKTGFWEVAALVMPLLMIGLLYYFRSNLN